jgi:hypothetical protein
VKDNRLTQPRRRMEQIIHCCQEALSAYEHHEDPRHVRDDLLQARELIGRVLASIEAQARGAARGEPR